RMMRTRRRCPTITTCEAAMLTFTMCTVLLASGQTEPALRFTGDARQPRVSARLSADVAAKLPAGSLTQEQGEAVLRFALFEDGKERAAMLGSYERQKETLVFVPRFPLGPEKTY